MKRMVILMAACVAMQGLCAKTFTEYKNEMAAMDVKIDSIADTHTVDMRERNFLYKNINPACYVDVEYKVALEMNNGDAVFLYPELMLDAPKQVIRRGYHIEQELRAAGDDPELDVRDLLKFINKKDMSKYADADTVVTYIYPFSKPFLGEYNYCIGVYLRKYGHPAMLLKIATKDSNITKAYDYINMLLGSISYGENQVKSLSEAEALTRGKSDFAFPSPARRGGIKLTPVESALTEIWEDGGREALDDLNAYRKLKREK